MQNIAKIEAAHDLIDDMIAAKQFNNQDLLSTLTGMRNILCWVLEHPNCIEGMESMFADMERVLAMWENNRAIRRGLRLRHVHERGLRN